MGKDDFNMFILRWVVGKVIFFIIYIYIFVNFFLWSLFFFEDKKKILFVFCNFWVGYKYDYDDIMKLIFLIMIILEVIFGER